MNETLRSIQNRRSCREYLTAQIKVDELETILQAGFYAPSAHNEQSWHFTVIQNQNTLNELNNDFKEVGKNVDDNFIKQVANDEKFHIFYHSPTVIIVSGDQKAILPQVDCAAATENMLIAAESLGIGSCWIGLAYWIFSSDKAADYKKVLNIPEAFIPYHAITLGYKKSEMTKVPERKLDKINYIK
ncbi:MAG: nitroreductase family protein [Candidatus Gastranaerophilales bacterium]|nr:nitroreductase family protein [Candidatus Gastranaerophilales bacterium]